MNQNNDQNGLFSDDYEAPKRENPYLKKNRDKARKEKRSLETQAPAVAEPQPYEDKPRPAQESSEERGVGYTRKRTFSYWMFEHVKLIATIATIIVVLSLVLITDVVGIVERMVTQSQQADKQEITLTYVKGLTEKADPITWTDLERFRYDKSDAKDSITWMLPVKDTRYQLWISGVSTDKPPLYVYLYDMRTGDRLVIGEEDFDSFIEEHSK